MLDPALALEILEQLDIAVLEYDSTGLLQVVQAPVWLSEVLVVPASRVS